MKKEGCKHKAKGGKPGKAPMVAMGKMEKGKK